MAAESQWWAMWKPRQRSHQEYSGLRLCLYVWHVCGNWNPPLAHVKSTCHLMLVRVVHIWLVRAFPLKTAASCFWLIKRLNQTASSMAAAGPGFKKSHRSCRRPWQSAGYSPNCSKSVWFIDEAASGFHSVSFSLFNLVKKNRWIIKTKASFLKKDLATRAEFTLKFTPLKEIL